MLAPPFPTARLLRIFRTLFAVGGLSVSALAQLQPFSMPWNDATINATDFSGLNATINPGDARIQINPTGQLTLNGERMRMLGANITAAAAFPVAADADGIAARMAKFGMNTVRFHHLEAPWQAGNVLIDYAGGTSREFSETHLDRLHYFIAQLAAHGLYTNMNLLVSRQFYPDDGFPASVSNLEWKEQQALSFFDAHMVTLQKEYARNLLTAPNPHRGNTALVDDTAVAFVEILNEYGYLQAWHDGTLDELPGEFADGLLAHWNTWLRNRYATTSDLLTGWNAVDEPLGAELLANADFSAGAASWNFEQHDTAVATATATTSFTGSAPALRVDVTTAGSAGWHVQLNQSGFGLIAGQAYTASYWARSTSGLPLTGLIGRASGDFGGIQTIGSATLTSAWQEFSVSFVPASSESSVRINFNGFGNQTGSVEIAAVSFKTGGAVGGLGDGVSLESANVPAVLKNGGSISAGQKTDWFRYLLDSEASYWDDMYSYIRDDLGYAGIIFGTIVSNSPAGMQARLDAVDSHYYWQHPAFPGNPWDPVNWNIPNTSAVNNSSDHVGSFARQRVKGKPFFNTEYQHADPNSYSSEMSLIPSAYGAFQDWDGLWFFEYGEGADGWDRDFISGFFAMDTHPGKMANTLLAANMFRRGDVAQATTEVIVGFDDATQLNVTTNSGGAWRVGDGQHLGLSARHAFETKVSLDTAQPAGTIPEAPTGNILTSDTGQLVWDNSVSNRGVVTVDTPGTKAVFGYVNSRTFDLDGWVFAPGATNRDWMTVGVTTVEGESLTSPQGFRALLITTGEVESTGWQWTDATQTSIANNWGSAPTLIEVIPMTVDLPVAAHLVSAWALDGTGERTVSLTVTTTSSGSRLNLGESGATLWYEIEVAADDSLAAPEIQINPNARLLGPGDSATLSVVATGTVPLTYQWTLAGNPIDGATGPTLALTNVSAADQGNYRVSVSNSLGAVTSRPARVVVDADPPASTGLANLSTRTTAGSGSAALIPGFVLAGPGQKEVLVRAIGPGLGQFGITTFVADPGFALIEQDAGEIAANDNWSATDIGGAFATVGAFGIETGSADAALRASISQGVYTAPIVDHAGLGGIALVELYDLANGASDLRVRNLSARGFVGSGNDVLIAGFAIPGSVPRRVLIRAIGPTLGGFGVAGTLEDPQLEVVQSTATATHVLGINDDWFRAGNAAEIAATSQTLGAFALGANSIDAAVLVELEPGAYSAIVRGADEGTGIALVEIYEVD